jgi:hypothetical protein
MTEEIRKVAREVAEEEVTNGFISVLNWDRDHPGPRPTPAEVIQWGSKKMLEEESERDAKVSRRRVVVGQIQSGIIRGVLGTITAFNWEKIARVARAIFGP